MEKPYRPDYRPDDYIVKWKRICRDERFENCAGFISAVGFLGTLRILYVYFNTSTSFLVACFYVFCLSIVLGIVLIIIYKISLLISPIDGKARQCAENQAEDAYNADMARYNHGLEAEDERYERRVMREIKGMRMRGEIEDEIALRRYSYLQTIQNSQNQQLIEVLNRAIQASNSGNYTGLSNNLKQLERELGL